MIKGHTHFIVDSGIGHVKKKLRKSNEFCLNHWAKVINSSSTANEVRLIDTSYVYDWKKALQSYFKPFDGISKLQYFATAFE